MKNNITFIKKSIKGVIVIGMAVQILLGIIWMGANLFSVQNFSETAEYLEMSRTFVLDEYVGVLYPLFLSICPIPTVVYGLQLAAAFVAGCVFLQSSGLGKEKLFSRENLFGAGYLLTVPFLMQLHMALLPASFMWSLFMVQLGLCMKVLRKKEESLLRDFGISCLNWFLMALLMPDYLWLGSVTVFILLVTGFKRKCGWRQAGILAVCMAAVILLYTGVNAIAQTPGSRGNIQRTLGAAVISRLAWPNFESNYYFWPEEVKEVMSPLKGREISQYAENVKTILGPLFEEAFGKEQANAYYWEMGLRCFFDRTREVLPRIVEDFAAYVTVPFSTGYQLSGGGVSYSGYNYDKMWEQAPVLTGWYVSYSVCALMAGILLTLIGKLLDGHSKEKRNFPKGCVRLSVCCILTQAVWYTMSGTYQMDYKNVPVIIALWYSVVIWGFMGYGKREGKD